MKHQQVSSFFNLLSPPLLDNDTSNNNTTQHKPTFQPIRRNLAKVHQRVHEPRQPLDVPRREFEALFHFFVFDDLEAVVDGALDEREGCACMRRSRVSMLV